MTKAEFERQVRLAGALRAAGVAEHDIQPLRRISLTLRRWFELECGDSNDYGSWAIERDGDEPDSKPFRVYHSHAKDGRTTRYAIPDRETGARRRLAAIMAKTPHLAAYVQTDPRGAALWILRPGDIREGSAAECCYTNGICVY